MTQNRQPEISIVLPAHNEGEGIADAVRTIAGIVSECVESWEVVIVDDGSRDDTWRRLAELSVQESWVRAIRFSRNFGKEAALLAGLEAAAGKAIITMDADLQHPPALIPKMIASWREGARVVHAVKADRSTDTWFARFRAAVFNKLLTSTGGIDIRNSSDYKLLDRTAVDVLIHAMPEKRRFYRGLADWVGYRQAEIQFSVAERNTGEGKWSLMALLDLAMTAIVSFTSAPLRIVTVLGFLTLLLGVVVGGDAIWSWTHGRAVSGFATMIITLLLIGSFIMISLGIVGEYIAKIYEEIKARPVYLVEERSGFGQANESPVAVDTQNDNA